MLDSLVWTYHKTLTNSLVWSPYTFKAEVCKVRRQVSLCRMFELIADRGWLDSVNIRQRHGVKHSGDSAKSSPSSTCALLTFAALKFGKQKTFKNSCGKSTKSTTKTLTASKVDLTCTLDVLGVDVLGGVNTPLVDSHSAQTMSLPLPCLLCIMVKHLYLVLQPYSFGWDMFSHFLIMNLCI